MVGLITLLLAAILSPVPTNGAVDILPVLLTPAPGCVVNGQTYHVGESYQPSPCEHCYCTASGRPVCAIADCFFTMCVDAIHDPTKCCPVCPNGPNCRAPDGTIIKEGDTYHMDANTICSCNSDHMMFGAEMSAMCAHTVN